MWATPWESPALHAQPRKLTFLNPVSAAAAAATMRAFPVGASEKSALLVPEERWRDVHPEKVRLVLTVPRETPGGLNEKYNFRGQRIELAADLGESVRDVKERLRPHLGDIPIKKLKLSTFHLGIMRDTLSLAFYNVKDGDKIAISVKERGGRARR